MNPSWQIPPHAIGLAQYDAIIDTRTPAEFAQDHIPGAINCPVFSNDERARVGTLYKQVSPFEARKLGATLVARNVADHIAQHFHSHPKHWRPLVYCWRGGQRSGAMQIILRQIGWQADKLAGGYKAFRHHVIEQTAHIAPQLRWHILCAATGSGKTRILQAIAAQGGQVLDLEQLAAHKGSVLGAVPHTPQPSQKAFETAIWQQLQRFNPALPVFAEAESRKIGNLQIPEPLLLPLRSGHCIDIEASTAARVDFLLRDYPYLQQDTTSLTTQLKRLKERLGKQTIADWEALIERQQWPELVNELLAKHYDPLYHQSQHKNYQGTRACAPIACNDLSDTGIAAIAQQILASCQ
ncbi:MAG: tRNA 2-selenouridine(34) synthase MnmH [Brachymonas sp.]|nr:tRNA 2-selenouridine(34) synthase MnmH [Brachymonas sp.]MBP7734226.1 tRNA 2-selenouridine(34) synthase MnmH [Brachymonas sp.]MBP8746890.1 tRNA 2-selenouridine(34) synthase MnmH [Brachymonas sp.]